MVTLLSKFVVMKFNDEWSGDCVAVSAQRFTAEEALKIGMENFGIQYMRVFKSFARHVNGSNSNAWEYGINVEGNGSVPVWIVTPMSAKPQVWIKQENVWNEKEVYVMKKV